MGYLHAVRQASSAIRAGTAMEFDIVIVGGGTAGCVVAAYLARHAALAVAVVEAGPRYPSWALDAPLAGLRLRPFWSWRHRTRPIPGLLERPVDFPMGRVVGGTSAVNAMIAAAGHPDDYAFLGDGDRPVETLRRDLEDLGMRTEAPRYRAGFTDAFLEACEERGLRLVEPLDGAVAGTCGQFRRFQREGVRWSAADLLADARRTGRVRILPRTSARAVIFRGNRAVGIETGGAVATGVITARVGVVLAAGTFGTPCLLQRSGIGPKRRLEAAGIRVRADLPGVGANLQDHLGVPWVVPSRVPAPGRPSRWVPAAIRFLRSRDGVMASNCCEAGCFLGEPGTRPTIEVFTHFQTAKRAGAVEFSTVLLHPESRGEVGIDPEDPWGPPRIEPNYLSSPLDRSRLAEGLARTVEIANAEPLLRFGLEPSRRELDPEEIRRRATTYFHPTGTCRQGDDAMGVTSRELRVHGTEGLWIADNSIVPDMPGGHTAMTALLVGAKAGRAIAALAPA